MAKQNAEPSGQDQEEIRRRRYLDTNILHIDLPKRTLGCLEREGIFFVGELAAMKATRLMALRGFGRKSLAAVKRVLGGLELGLSMDVGDWKPPVS
jgi:DNA-directed RNA polymerase alpha subunit